MTKLQTGFGIGYCPQSALQRLQLFHQEANVGALGFKMEGNNTMKHFLCAAAAAAGLAASQGLAQDKSLYSAVDDRDLSLVESLIAAGKNPNFLFQFDDGDKWAALHRAADINALPMAKLLIDKGADVNIRGGKKGYTPLHFAVRHGSLPMAKLLIDNGANPNVELENGKTPLYHAAQKENRLLVHMLMQAGAVDEATYKISNTHLGRPSYYWSCEVRYQRVKMYERGKSRSEWKSAGWMPFSQPEDCGAIPGRSYKDYCPECTAKWKKLYRISWHEYSFDEKVDALQAQFSLANDAARQAAKEGLRAAVSGPSQQRYMTRHEVGFDRFRARSVADR